MAARKRRPSHSGTYHADQIPLNLLSKLLIFVRTPEEGEDPATLDDMTWCRAMLVSTYRHGWKMLEESGYVDFNEEWDHTNLESVIAVRFTQKGLAHALKATVSDKSLAANAIEGQKVAADRNSDRQGFGEF